MKQFVAGVLTLTAIVAGIVVATSFSSAAQEDDGSGDTTATTLADESGFTGRFGFRLHGDSLPDLADLEVCLTEQGIEIPDDLGRGFMFELKDDDVEGLAEALETCGLPGFGDGFRFHNGESPFDGDLPPMLAELEECLTEQGIEIPDDLDRGFLFELPEEDIEGLAEALEVCGLPGAGHGFSMHGDFLEGFPFDGELPEGFPFGGDGSRFHFGAPALNLDELATCLAELGSFEGVEDVRDQLENCLPAATGPGGLEGFESHHGRGGSGPRFGPPFGGHGPFGFDLDDNAPNVEDTST